MSNIILEAKNVCKSFGKREKKQIVLNNMNLTVNKGSMIAIKGKSGNGKSTLLNILALMMMADSGNVLYNGIDLQQLSNSERAKDRKECIGYIPQNLYLLDDRNVYMNIALPLQYAGENKNIIKKKVYSIAEEFDITHLLYKKSHMISRGEKQRVAICRSIIKMPEILFADEPTGSLDEENEKIVLRMFENLRKAGTTVVLTTHDDTVASMCDTVYNIVRPDHKL